MLLKITEREQSGTQYPQGTKSHYHQVLCGNYWMIKKQIELTYQNDKGAILSLRVYDQTIYHLNIKMKKQETMVKRKKLYRM